MKLAILLLSLALSACAQTPATRTVTLTWVDTVNPAGTTYTIYKSSNPTAQTPTFAVLASGVTAKSYVDAGVVPGLYRYYVKAVFNNSESVPSNSADADAKPFPPLSFRAEANVEVPQ